MTVRMSRPEAVVLCRLAKAACPQQAFDEYTPDAWFEMLNDYRFEDCKAALFEVTKRQPFAAPSEIRAEIRKARYERVAKFGYIEPPGEFDSFVEEQAAITAIRQRVADGNLTRDEYDAELRNAGVLGSHEMPALEGVFRRVEE